jgi:hypothetical protein
MRHARAIKALEKRSWHMHLKVTKHELLDLGQGHAILFWEMVSRTLRESIALPLRAEETRIVDPRAKARSSNRHRSKEALVPVSEPRSLDELARELATIIPFAPG